jgi:hypothetical protein
MNTIDTSQIFKCDIQKTINTEATKVNNKRCCNNTTDQQLGHVFCYDYVPKVGFYLEYTKKNCVDQ